MSGYEEQELVEIDAALDDNPDATSEEVFQATRPYDARAIASAAASRALAGGGGSSSPVGVVLQLSPAGLSALDLGAGGGGTKFVKWDTMYDNTFAFNSLSAIPDGLGLDFAFDGSDSVFTATEAGIWNFQFTIQLPTDADILGHFGFRNIDITDGYFGPGTDSAHETQSSFNYSAALLLPEAGETEFLIAAGNSGSPFNPAYVAATIVRLV